MDFLGTTSRGVQPSSAGFLADMGYENTCFAPVINSNATRDRTSSFMPKREISLGFIQDVKDTSQQRSISEFPVTPKTHCLQA